MEFALQVVVEKYRVRTSLNKGRPDNERKGGGEG